MKDEADERSLENILLKWCGDGRGVLTDSVLVKKRAESGGVKPYTVGELVPTSSEEEESVYRFVFEERKKLRDGIQGVNYRSVPILPDLDQWVPFENVLRWAEAIRRLQERGIERLLVVCKGYSEYHLALLDEAERIGVSWSGEATLSSNGAEVRKLVNDNLQEVENIMKAASPSKLENILWIQKLSSKYRRVKLVFVLASAIRLYTNVALRVILEAKKKEVSVIKLSTLPEVHEVYRRLGVESELLLDSEEIYLERFTEAISAVRMLVESLKHYASSLSFGGEFSKESIFRHILMRVPNNRFYTDAYSLMRCIDRLIPVLTLFLPKSVYMIPSACFLENSVVSLARGLGIPIITSVCASIDERYRNLGHYPTDIITVINEEQKKAFLARGYDERCILCCGDVAMDETLEWMDENVTKYLIDFNLDAERGFALVATSGLDLTEEVWIGVAAEVCRQLGFKLVVKVHPSIAEERYFKLSKLQVLVTKEAELIPLVRGARVVITDVSHAGMYAIYLRKPLLTVNLTGKPYPYNRFDEQGAALLARSLEELRSLLKKLLVDEEARERLLSSVQKIMPRLLFKNDGKAAERVLNLLLKPPNGALLRSPPASRL